MSNIVDNKLLKCCYDCKESKPLINFHKHNKERDGLYYLCKLCAKKQKDKNKLNSPFPDETFLKMCPSCKVTKNANDFGPCKERKDGVQYRCKICALNTARQDRNSVDGRINFIYSNAKRNLKRPSKTLEMTITKDDLIELYNKQHGYCALSGIKMEHTINNNENSVENKYNISIDRINSNVGYVKDNIQLVCWVINQMKSDIDPELFLGIITKIYNKSVINNL
jgi:hypothetical protein